MSGQDRSAATKRRDWSKEQRRFDRPGPLRRLRFRLAVWLLKPHWLPLLESYNRAADTETHPKGNAERCAYIAIGIKYAIGVTRWGRYK